MKRFTLVLGYQLGGRFGTNVFGKGYPVMRVHVMLMRQNNERRAYRLKCFGLVASVQDMSIHRVDVQLKVFTQSHYETHPSESIRSDLSTGERSVSKTYAARSAQYRKHHANHSRSFMPPVLSHVPNQEACFAAPQFEQAPW
jgi:hypothetical protein